MLSFIAVRATGANDLMFGRKENEWNDGEDKLFE